MKKAIVKINSKQYEVSEGQELKIDRVGEKPEISVLFYSDDKDVLIGSPELSDVSVTVKKLKDLKDEKVVVRRFKAKSRYHKVKGHRQPISIVKVEKIVKKGAKKDGA